MSDAKLAERPFGRGSLIVHYNGEPLNSRDRWYAGAGATIGRYINRIYVFEVGVGGNIFQPLENLRGSASNPWEVEGYGSSWRTSFAWGSAGCRMETTWG